MGPVFCRLPIKFRAKRGKAGFRVLSEGADDQKCAADTTLS